MAAPLSGKTVAVTGELPSLSREEAAMMIEQLGGRFVSSVSAKTSFLLAGEGLGGKAEKARSLGVPIHDEAWLLSLDAATPADQKIDLKAGEVAAVMARIASMSRPTWDCRQELDIVQVKGIKEGLLRAGITTGSVGEKDSRIVCVLAMSGDVPSALVCCPNDLMFIFTPSQFEESFWRFALDHYFVVTWNAADRQLLADKLGVDVAKIDGKNLVRTRDSERSWMPLGDMLVDIGCVF